MKHKNKITVRILALCIAAAAILQPARAAEIQEAAVLAAVNHFYAALNQLFTGEVKPMTDLWSHAPDVTYMGPSGEFQSGWPQILKEWEFQGSKKLGGKVVPADIHIMLGTDMAVACDIEQGENTNANGEVQKVSIRATNIFRKEGGQWKMIGHHTDMLPWLTPSNK